MENSVNAAPLLVRKGIRYTKLAVTLTGIGDERRGTLLHLGTGEDTHKKDIETENRMILRSDNGDESCAR